jgi:hypothetical protein
MASVRTNRSCSLKRYRAGQGKLEWIWWLSLRGATIVLHVERKEVVSYSVSLGDLISSSLTSFGL